MIRYLRRHQIDEAAWNAAVAADPARLPYGCTWWLDAATDHRWHGIVLDDYRLVFPLPYARGVGKLLQIQRPPFTQQVGPWGNYLPGDLARISTRVPATALRLDLPLSERVSTSEIPAGYTATERVNYLLDLSPGPETVRQGFQRTLRRKLRKYAGPLTLTDTDAQTIIDLYAPTAGVKAGLKAVHYTRVSALMETCRWRDTAAIVRLDCPEHGLLAAGFFPLYRRRMVNTFAASSPVGYRREGMARLLVALMESEEYAPTLLDFEGSELPGVAEFFRSFGPQDRGYLRIRRK